MIFKAMSSTAWYGLAMTSLLYSTWKDPLTASENLMERDSQHYPIRDRKYVWFFDPIQLSILLCLILLFRGKIFENFGTARFLQEIENPAIFPEETPGRKTRGFRITVKILLLQVVHTSAKDEKWAALINQEGEQIFSKVLRASKRAFSSFGIRGPRIRASGPFFTSALKLAVYKALVSKWNINHFNSLFSRILFDFACSDILRQENV